MLTIYTTGETFNFEGKDAINVYKHVDEAGARGAAWTTPIEMKNGKRIVFILRNIVAIEFLK